MKQTPRTEQKPRQTPTAEDEAGDEAEEEEPERASDYVSTMPEEPDPWGAFKTPEGGITVEPIMSYFLDRVLPAFFKNK